MVTLYKEVMEAPIVNIGMEPMMKQKLTSMRLHAAVSIFIGMLLLSKNELIYSLRGYLQSFILMNYIKEKPLYKPREGSDQKLRSNIKYGDFYATLT